DNFPCNFNVLIDGVPKQLGIRGILVEWIRFRTNCLTREFNFELAKKSARLHLLLGLGKILLDIDKAVKIVKETEKDEDVVPNLMKGFDVDKEQAEYIADIKLRHLNREYIMNRLADIETIRKEMAMLKELLEDELKMKAYIVKQLMDIKKKYAKPRKTQIIEASDITTFSKEIMIEDYTARLFYTKDGYLKKITQQSLRGNSEQKFKEGDELVFEGDVSNKDELIFFTDKCQLYFAKMSDFELSKASDLGVYVPKQLNFDDDEHPVFMKINPEFSDKQNVIFFFENGKAVRIPTSQYATQGSRKKLKKAFSDASPIVGVVWEENDNHLLIINSEKKAILIRPSLIPIKATRTSQGTTVFAMNLKKKHKVVKVVVDYKEKYPDAASCRKTKIPATGVLMNNKIKQLKIQDLED
ncbi:MAG: topoisomerase IV, partial [Clostridia bacterium]|nr:topoisomerase IV [Clostridia bacterium]